MLDDEAAPLNFDRQKKEKKSYHELLKKSVSF